MLRDLWRVISSSGLLRSPGPQIGAHPDWNHSMLVEAPTAQERRQVRFDGALCNCCCVSLRRHSTVVQSELEGRRPHQDRSGQSLELTKLEPVRRNRPAQQSEPEEFLECRSEERRVGK